MTGEVVPLPVTYENKTSLLMEKSGLTERLSELALRQAMFFRMMTETTDEDKRAALLVFVEEAESEAERAANRIGDINSFIRDARDD